MQQRPDQGSRGLKKERIIACGYDTANTGSYKGGCVLLQENQTTADSLVGL